MKVEKVGGVDPYWLLGDEDDKVFRNTLPRTRVTLNLPPRTAMHSGLLLFWMATKAWILRRGSITFWMEDGS